MLLPYEERAGGGQKNITNQLNECHEKLCSIEKSKRWKFINKITNIIKK